MIYTGNPLVIKPAMVFFLHMIFINRESRRAMTLGHSVLVTENGNRRLSRYGTELLVC
jgi:Xaa-Pro dipeptidase